MNKNIEKKKDKRQKEMKKEMKPSIFFVFYDKKLNQNRIKTNKSSWLYQTCQTLITLDFSASPTHLK